MLPSFADYVQRVEPPLKADVMVRIFFNCAIVHGCKLTVTPLAALAIQALMQGQIFGLALY